MNGRLSLALVMCLLLSLPGSVTAQGPSSPRPNAADGPGVSAEGDPSLEYVSQIGGACEAVAVQGNFAYVGLGPRLRVLDVSDPAHRVVLGLTDVLRGVVKDIAVAGQYAYVVDESGLRIVDVSDPNGPVVLSSLDTASRPCRIQLRGRYVYIGTCDGLTLVDVSDPRHPALTGYWSLPNRIVHDIGLVGEYAYVAAQFSGVLIVNVSDPAHPVEVASCPFTHSVYAVTIAARHAYVAWSDEQWPSTGSGLQVLDISDPLHPRAVGQCEIESRCLDHCPELRVALEGSYAHVMGATGMETVDVADPAHPAAIGVYDTPGTTIDAVISGGYAYVADTAGMRILRVSDPRNVTEVGFYYTPGDTTAVAVSGNVACMVTRPSIEHGLRVVDVYDPAHPRGVGLYSPPAPLFGVKMAGDYAYVAAGEAGLRIINVSDMAHPIEVGSVRFPEEYIPEWMSASDVVLVARGAAYVNLGWRVAVVDVRNPVQPTCSAILWVGGGFDPPEIASDGNFLYVWYEESGDTGNCFLHIYDVRDPMTLVLAGDHGPFRGGAWLDAAAGGYAYLESRDGLIVLDCRDPAHPVEVGRCQTPARINAISGARGYGFYGPGLHLIDLIDPAHPVEVASYEYSPIPYDQALVGGYLYIANGNGGMMIFRDARDRDRVTAIISPEGGSLASTGGDTSFAFGPGAFSSPVRLIYRHLWARTHVDDHVGLKHAFDLSALYPDTGQLATLAPGQTYTVTVHYTDTELGWSTIETSLALHYWDGSQWIKEPSSAINAATNTVTASPNHLSEWAVLGETWRVFLPVVRK